MSDDHHEFHDANDNDLGSDRPATDDLGTDQGTALTPSDAVSGLPSTGLFSFYDRLRARVTRVATRRGKLTAAASEALLLVPDVFLLLTRLALDRDVPREQRALVASALAYFVLPVDFLPEAVLGPAGYLDDLVLAATVLAHAFSGDLEPFTAKHWSGSKKLRIVLKDVLESANSLVGGRVYEQLLRLLGRYGVNVSR